MILRWKEDSEMGREGDRAHEVGRERENNFAEVGERDRECACMRWGWRRENALALGRERGRMCLHFVVREGGLHELGRAGERLCSREVGMMGKFSTLEL